MDTSSRREKLSHEIEVKSANQSVQDGVKTVKIYGIQSDT